MTARKTTAKTTKAAKPRAARAPRTTPEPADELRPLHTGEHEPAPIFAFEHPTTGLLVLDKTAERNADGVAVNKRG